MIKITWSTVTEPHTNFFVIANVESAQRLVFYLEKLKTNDGTQPINIQCWDLSGYLIDTKPGLDQLFSYQESTL